MQDEVKKVTVIINPVSGTGKKHNIGDLIRQSVGGKFDVTIEKTMFPGHAREIAAGALKAGANAVVVAGGDGTINEAAGALINSPVKFGIIPNGSGNGLARHLQIPLNAGKALDVISRMNTLSIDAGMANDHPFFCTAGIGFDAYIGNEFLHGKSRGLYGYVNHVIREYFRYKSGSYAIQLNGSVENKEAFIITVANAGQYGNNAYIAPAASISDGYLDLCVVRDFPRLNGIGMSIKLFAKSINKSPYYTNEKIRSVRIGAPENSFYHLDGEIFPYESDLEISVVPKCLEVIVP